MSVGPLVFALALAAGAPEPSRNAYERARQSYFALKESKDKQRFRHNWVRVIAAFREVTLNWPRSEESARAAYTTAELWRDLYDVSRRSDDVDQALLAYGMVVDDYATSSLADDAMLARARILLERGDRVGAAREVRALTTRYPTGDMAIEAQRLAESLRDVVVPATAEPHTARRQQVGRSTAGVASITSLTHWSGPAYTRIAVGLSAQVRARSGEAEGGQIVVDFDRARLDAKVRELAVEEGIVARVRAVQRDANTVRVTIDLRAPARHRVLYIDSPRRMVIDAFPEAASAPVVSAARRHVVLDAGHGGADSGAKGPGKVREKDVVLAIVLETARLLEKAGIRVTLTRRDDVFLSLDERAAVANRVAADAFVSVHANSNPSKEARGIETYYLDVTDDRYALRLAAVENQMEEDDVSDLQLILADLSTKANIPESLALAKAVQSRLVAAARSQSGAGRDLGVKGSLFYVLLGARMPAILVETSFLSHPEEGKLLGTSAYQKTLAKALADALVAQLAARPVQVAGP